MSLGSKKVVQLVVRDFADFDKNSGNAVERLFFNHRGVVVAICILVTVALGYSLTKLKLNANFDRMIPTRHPYIANYLQHKSDLSGLGNTVRIAVETTNGTIYDAS